MTFLFLFIKSQVLKTQTCWQQDVKTISLIFYIYEVLNHEIDIFYIFKLFVAILINVLLKQIHIYIKCKTCDALHSL